MRVRIHWHSAGEQGQSLLPFPGTRNSRIAQVGDFPMFPGLPWFYVEWWEALLKLKPEILVGPRDSLLRLSEAVARRRIDFPVDTALFSLTRVGERPLLDATRDQFWQVFGVPVFEIYITRDGVILASECEAHNGWHVNPKTACISKLTGEPHLVLNRLGNKNQVFQAVGMGFAADITSDPCECGQTTVRVVNLPATDVFPLSHCPQVELATRALAAAS